MKQVEAITCLQTLVAKGTYKAEHLGVFARDLNSNGAKSFFVDTFAGLALASARMSPPSLWNADASQHVLSSQERSRYAQHFYEVILDERPCWLYFDLEFKRSLNPESEPAVVAREFYAALDRFLESVLGCRHEPDSVVELDSTTPEKFSKHVLVKRLVDGRQLAFLDNGHAGVLVMNFIKFMEAERQQDTATASNLFFFSDADDKERGTSLVDGCVYSRNRCFRLLFSSKFGKKRPLTMSRGDALRQPPPLQLLSSIASFVPSSTILFSDERIPLPVGRPGVASGSRKCKAKKCTNTGGINGDRNEDGVANERPGLVHVRLAPDSPYVMLFKFLVEHWDKARAKHERSTGTAPTKVQSSVLVGDGRYLCVTLSNNRFCFRKGMSHKANSIYFVIDQSRKVFYQKCHDTFDCGRDFRSTEEMVPYNLLPQQDDEDPPEEMNQAKLSIAVAETQALLEETLPPCEEPIAPTLVVCTPAAGLSKLVSDTLEVFTGSHDSLLGIPHDSQTLAQTVLCNTFDLAPTVPDSPSCDSDAQCEPYFKKTQNDPPSPSSTEEDSDSDTVQDSDTELDASASNVSAWNDNVQASQSSQTHGTSFTLLEPVKIKASDALDTLLCAGTESTSAGCSTLCATMSKHIQNAHNNFDARNVARPSAQARGVDELRVTPVGSPLDDAKPSQYSSSPLKQRMLAGKVADSDVGRHAAACVPMWLVQKEITAAGESGIFTQLHTDTLQHANIKFETGQKKAADVFRRDDVMDVLFREMDRGDMIRGSGRERLNRMSSMLWGDDDEDQSVQSKLVEKHIRHPADEPAVKRQKIIE